MAGLFFTYLFLIQANLTFAQLDGSAITAMEKQDNALLNSSPFEENFTIGAAVATIVKAFLGLLGIIFIFLMVLAGYHWMTAAGDEQKVTKAKDTLRTAIIGLVIIVAAYSITYFVLNAIGKSTS